MGRIILVRPLLPPPVSLGARLKPQHLHWQVGRYRERLTSGPGGLGRGRIWVPQLEGEQHNLILNAAYDTLIPQYGFLLLHSYAAIGTGSTPPAATQTNLANEVVRTRRDDTGSTSGSYSIIYTGTPGVYDLQVVREFVESEVGGRNLTEWGFSPISNANGTLMARELFRDGSGNPIVITLATDQRLRLIYKIRVTISPVSQAVSLNISGLGTFTGTFRLYKTAARGSVGYQNTDLQLLDSFARGSTTFVDATLQLLWMSQVQRASYDPGFVNAQGSVVDYKTPTYGNVSGRSRQILAQVWASNEANGSSLSYGIGIGSFLPGAIAFISFDTAITKGSLYKLQIDAWSLNWGP